MAKTYDVPLDTFAAGSMDQYAPELVSPAAVFLAHESCRLDGAMLVAGGGTVMRVAFVCNEGITDEHMTPEAVAEGLDKILDLSDSNEVIIETLTGDEIAEAREALAAD